MEEERKRKRAEKGEIVGVGGGGRRKKERELAGQDVEAVVKAPPPTEEEVEEFFAILKRMRVAVKYLKSNGNVDGRKLTGRLETALETEVLEHISVVNKVCEKKTKGGAEKDLLDLNVVPEGESSSF